MMIPFILDDGGSYFSAGLTHVETTRYHLLSTSIDWAMKLPAVSGLFSQEIELPQFEARERIIEVPMSLIEETYVAWPGAGSTWEGLGRCWNWSSVGWVATCGNVLLDTADGRTFAVLLRWNLWYNWYNFGRAQKLIGQ
jgi:hypothetical protein